ncbi:hypothetical protein VB715_03295 [Crocosphaera sp. UHCC 0190]|uniref:hypothetical protein n=1 Tax=Crocosphaera sp. UHCC 0190 TaxID=3110246 RepID=UPI002B2103DF|nr:hypothetical protein [Crocosphaera sp. UHCC 0190]MEA5508779.1 hypothetical protein [Crocosphaera sp. UHCC 0190]
MSGHESNLSLPQYGYDLVVSTTQESINATMKQFLDKFEGKDFISCYVSQEQSDGTYTDVPGDYDQLSKIAGMDLFSIPTTNQTAAQKAAADKAYDKYFSFAFKATMGLPDFPLESIPNVIILDKGSVIVTYNLFFKDFRILNAEPQRRGYSWTNLSQADAPAPWVFQFNVKLDLNSSDSAFSHLPESVQRKVKNLNKDSAFSVQQLYLDLNTAGLESPPTVVGLENTSTAYIYLTRVFISSYFKQLQEQSKDPANPDGNILLGYSVKPTKPSTTSSSIIPTDLTFMVSPFRDENGVPTKSHDLYTLNYLVMSDNHHMPAPVEFGWNWVKKSEESDYAGTMTIKKGIFASFLNQQLSPSLKSVCLIPSCSIHVNLIKIEWNCSYKSETTPQTYQVVNDGTSKVLTFSYSRSAHDSDTFGPNWGNITLTNSLQSDIYLENNIIRTVTTATAYVHINLYGGVTEGNFVKYQTETSYQIGVDQSGNLTITLTTGSPHFSDLSDNIDPSGWSKFVTLGQINGVVDKVKIFWTHLKDFLDKHEQEILEMLRGSGVWVFPGGKTFIFKDVYFSDNQDLVAHITYVDPEESSLF